MHGGLGRKFGSIGLSLSAPHLVLTASRADKLQIAGGIDSKGATRANNIAQQLIKNLNLTGSVALNIQQVIPEHAGLGSGTQLVLAIGAAISKLYHLDLTTSQIAMLTGRGNRSGIGIAAFDLGGLLIDGGRKAIGNVPPLLARYDFPKSWRVLLILDATQPGIHGEEEKEAFNNLPIFLKT